MTSPSLIEPGVRYFIGGSLKECRKFKEKHYNMFFNLGMIVLFISVFGGILWYRHKGRLTSQEMDIKNRKKKEYIISKLYQLHDIKKTKNLITDLPTWGNNPELSILQRKI